MKIKYLCKRRIKAKLTDQSLAGLVCINSFSIDCWRMREKVVRVGQKNDSLLNCLIG